MNYTFTPIAREHEAPFKAMLAESHVRQWWGEEDFEWRLVREGEATGESRGFAIFADDTFLGYIQVWVPNWNPENLKEEPWQADMPEGTRGVDIDVLARDALWRAGLDYAHGTGHGVGSYLGVHEGPQGISRRSMEPFEPGMIVSNEPGYYREGTFGIRLENLVVVQEPAEIEGGDVPMMAFETITLAPLDRRLIRFDMLSPRECEWIDAYHARVRDELSDRVETEARDWLERATAPLEPPAT